MYWTGFATGAVKCLEQLAALLLVPPLSEVQLTRLLPPEQVSETGELRQRVRCIAAHLSEAAVVHIVDKGPGQLWGFVRDGHDWNCRIFCGLGVSAGE